MGEEGSSKGFFDPRPAPTPPPTPPGRPKPDRDKTTEDDWGGGEGGEGVWKV